MTLLLRDYIVEHDIDLFAITETWLTDDSLDESYCRDICPEGYKGRTIRKLMGGGGGAKYKKNIRAREN